MLSNRVDKTTWLILVLLLLPFAGFASYLAPAGSWLNQIQDTAVWFEYDPAGLYVVSAHEIFPPRHWLGYAGHPGITLQLALYAVQRGYYWTVGWSSPYSFSEFTARHLPSVFFLSKMLITIVQSATWWLLLIFARRFLKTDRARAFALAAYATSFPVLYYLSRISVEPFVILFFLLTFVALWRAEERQEFWPAVGAGAAAISGFYTKLHLLFLLPLVGLGWLITRPKSALLRRQIAGYLVGAVITIAFYGLFMSWTQFFQEWAAASPTAEKHSLLKPLWDLLRIPLSHWVPSIRLSGIFLFLEFGLGVLGVTGAAIYSVSRRRVSVDLVAVAIVVLGSIASWAYRSSLLGDFQSFHYLLPLLVLGSLFAGYLWDHVLVEMSPQKNLVAIALGVIVLHHPAIWSVADSRARDVVKYRRYYRPLFRAVDALPAGERVGVVRRDGVTFSSMDAGGLQSTQAHPRLIEVHRDLFVDVDRASAGWRQELEKRGVKQVVDLGADQIPSEAHALP